MPPIDSTHAGSPRFATTRWSLVVAAAGAATPAARAALETLCAGYWFPLYAFARRSGHGVEEAQDLVQSFFAKLLEEDGLARADAARGRFRTFLLTAFRNHASHARARDRALKRGGGRPVLSLDAGEAEERLGLEPLDHATPERIFLREWALSLLDEALEEVRRSYAARGKADLFQALKGRMVASDDGSTAEAARALGMSEGAVRVALHRLRRRYRQALRDQVAQTLAGDPGAVEEELQLLLEALAL